MTSGTITVHIKSTDSDFYTCPHCNNGYITKAFQRCIDCGSTIKWEV